VQPVPAGGFELTVDRRFPFVGQDFGGHGWISKEIGSVMRLFTQQSSMFFELAIQAHHRTSRSRRVSRRCRPSQKPQQHQQDVHRHIQRTAVPRCYCEGCRRNTTMLMLLFPSPKAPKAPIFASSGAAAVQKRRLLPKAGFWHGVLVLLPTMHHVFPSRKWMVLSVHEMCDVSHWDYQREWLLCASASRRSRESRAAGDGDKSSARSPCNGTAQPLSVRNLKRCTSV
jgi:hypothetical protein